MKLKGLKRNESNPMEIKALSQLIRHLVKTKQKIYQIGESLPTEKDFKNNFWKSCSRVLRKVSNISPNFSLLDCFKFFQSTLYDNKSHAFVKPSWFIGITKPVAGANIAPPSYSEIATIINRTRSNSAPCPLDHMNIIMFKRCPILRTYLHKLIVECWEKRYTPKSWRKGVSILIFKKGDSSDPNNFRPITLQNILFKIVATSIRNRLQSFLNSTGAINTNIQKGLFRNVMVC